MKEGELHYMFLALTVVGSVPLVTGVERICCLTTQTQEKRLGNTKEMHNNIISSSSPLLRQHTDEIIQMMVVNNLCALEVQEARRGVDLHR